ncbi:hypothetical protein HMPREF0063_12321 [Aeromicrobium marinum DSM 15272]|uniref:Uncharacterized protein n=1 Tax=Aeromicrobium marinum DSM 15272 TaxID=585531 RepID=E2SD09_9ACTN|nr:hypothetical protein [Aeromicrobium marinum]EFQ83112.1 hypothetical protein HMPREF0063_12321 [Aeromicrobium marinum DSM 15272]
MTWIVVTVLLLLAAGAVGLVTARDGYGWRPPPARTESEQAGRTWPR